MCLYKKQSIHNADIDEKYHQLTEFNVLSVASFASFLQFIDNGDISGDIVECGIGRSRSLLILCSLTHAFRKRRIVAYDSFCGFPQPTVHDTSKRNPQKGDWAHSPSGKYKYTKDFCKYVLQSANIDLNSVDLELVEGYFEDTLGSNSSDSIALLNIDGDLYSSYKNVLESLYHKVSKGGIIIFDDFEELGLTQCAFPGARLAAMEFLGDSVYSQIQVNDFGVYYLIKP